MNIIYKAKNIKDDKCYIGFTSGTMKNRIQNHIKSMKSGSKYFFHNALRMYGIESFEFTVLFTSKDKDFTLDVMEPLLIKENRSHYSVGGYNMSWGGEAPMLGRKHKPETIEKMSKKHTELGSGDRLPHNGFVGKKNGMFGKTSAFKGKHHSENSKRIFRKNHSKDYMVTFPNKERVLVNNLKEFASDNNLSYQCLNYVANNKQKHHKGFVVEKVIYNK